MRRWISLILLATLVSSGLLISQSLAAQDATPQAQEAPAATPQAIASPQTSSPGISLFAGGLQNPRGFDWDSTGAMYVALAGTGGSVSFPSATSGEATPIPDFAGKTASVVRIAIRDDVVTLGCPVVVASGLPSTRGMNGHDQGPADIAFLGGKMYVLQDGGDSAVLFPEFPNGVYSVNPDGTLTLVADVRDWVQQNPVSHLAYDQGPEGETFAMVAGDSFLWVVESNSGQVLKISPEGEITRMADLSEGHPVPTGITRAPDGGVYVSFLGSAPYPDGTSKVIKIDPVGNVTTVWTGLTMVTALAVSPAGNLYALEMSTGNDKTPPYVHPNSGRIVKQTGPNSLAEVVVGLDYPIAMATGPDGALYVSTPAFGADSDLGGIIRIDLSYPQPMTISPDIVEMSTCDVPTPEPRPSTLGGAGAVANTGMLPTPVDTAAGNSDAGQGAESSNQGGKSATGAFAIEIKNFSFNPKDMTVPVGTTVTWTNMDSVAHTATADDGAFNSGNLNPGQAFSFQFEKAGTFDYSCTYHPGMKGTVTVQ